MMAQQALIYFFWKTTAVLVILHKFVHSLECPAIANQTDSSLSGVITGTNYKYITVSTSDTTIGTEVNIACYNGDYVLIGASNLTCLDNGSWSADVPKCEPRPKEHIFWTEKMKLIIGCSSGGVLLIMIIVGVSFGIYKKKQKEKSRQANLADKQEDGLEQRLSRNMYTEHQLDEFVKRESKSLGSCANESYYHDTLHYNREEPNSENGHRSSLDMVRDDDLKQRLSRNMYTENQLDEYVKRETKSLGSHANGSYYQDISMYYNEEPNCSDGRRSSLDIVRFYRVWTTRRDVKKYVAAENLVQLLIKSRQKFNLPLIASVVLDENGETITCDGDLKRCKDHTLLLLQRGEAWSPPEEDYRTSSLKRPSSFYRDVIGNETISTVMY